MATAAPSVLTTPPTLFMNAPYDTFIDLPLRRRIELTDDTLLLTFGLPWEDCTTGLHMGQHLYARVGDTQRPYTPVTPIEAKGAFDLVIKVYRPNAAFPAGGKLSQLLGDKAVGDTVAFKPARCKLRYDGSGAFSVLIPAPAQVHGKHVLMIAGGTGLTPMMQLIERVLRAPTTPPTGTTATTTTMHDPTVLTLLCCVRHPNDVLLRSVLEAWAVAHPAQLKIYVTFSGPAGAPPQSSGDHHAPLQLRSGRITPALIEEALASQHLLASDAVTLICGPHSLNESCKHMLHDLHFHHHAVFAL